MSSQFTVVLNFACFAYLVSKLSRINKRNERSEYSYIGLGYVFFFAPTIENREELWIRVCFSFFSTQNQLPKSSEKVMLSDICLSISIYTIFK